MASPVNQTTALIMVQLLAQCITLTPSGICNPLFSIILASEELVLEMLRASGLVFVSGFLDVLQSVDPPALTWFNSLPSKARGFLAVYLLVLEKDGCRSKIYVGSGTDQKHGVWNRARHYELKCLLPLYGQTALDEPYVITHFGLLCWAPVPGPLLSFPLRALFLALETVFSCIFWAMKSRKWTFMHSICPWDVEKLPYDRCCTHLSLSEKTVGGDSRLTDTEIEAAEEKRLQHSKEYQAEYYQWHKEHGSEEWHAARRVNKSRYLANVKDSGVINCVTCDRIFETLKDKQRHEKSNIHNTNIAGIMKTVKHPGVQARNAANKASSRYSCSPCNKTFVTQQKLTQHVRGKRHAKKAGARCSQKTSFEHSIINGIVRYLRIRRYVQHTLYLSHPITLYKFVGSSGNAEYAQLLAVGSNEFGREMRSPY